MDFQDSPSQGIWRVVVLCLLSSQALCDLLQEDKDFIPYRCISGYPNTTQPPFPFNTGTGKNWTAWFVTPGAISSPNLAVRTNNKMSWLPIYEESPPNEVNSSPRKRREIDGKNYFGFSSETAMYVSNLHKIIYATRPGTTGLWYFYYGNDPRNGTKYKHWYQVESGFTSNFHQGMKAVILEDNYPFDCYDTIDRFPYQPNATRGVCFFGWDGHVERPKNLPVVQCSLVAPQGETPSTSEVWEDFDRTNAPIVRSKFAIAADRTGFFIHGGRNQSTDPAYISEFSDFWYYKAPREFWKPSPLNREADTIFPTPGWYRLPSGPGLCGTPRCNTNPRCSLNVHPGTAGESCKRSHHTLVPLFDSQNQIHPTHLLLFGGTWKINGTYRTETHYSNALWEYNVQRGTWREIHNPSGDRPSQRSGHTAVVTTDKQITSFRMVMRIYGGTNKEAKEFRHPTRLGLPLCDTWAARVNYCFDLKFQATEDMRHYNGRPWFGACANYDWYEQQYYVDTNASQSESEETGGFLSRLGTIESFSCIGRGSSANAAVPQNDHNEIYDYYPGLERWKQKNSEVEGVLPAKNEHQAAVVPGGMIVYGAEINADSVRGSSYATDYMHILLDIMNFRAIEVWNETNATEEREKNVQPKLPLVEILYGRGVEASFEPFIDPFTPVDMRLSFEAHDNESSDSDILKTLEFTEAATSRMSLQDLLQGTNQVNLTPGTLKLEWDSSTFATAAYREQNMRILTRRGKFQALKTHVGLKMRSQDVLYDAAMNLVTFRLETSVPPCGTTGIVGEQVTWIPKGSQYLMTVCRCDGRPLELQDVCIPCEGNYCGDCGPGYMLEYSNITSQESVKKVGLTADTEILGVESQCFPCPAGRYRDMFDVEGQAFTETCTPCPLGRYQSATGQTACEACSVKNTRYVKLAHARAVNCPADESGSRSQIQPGIGWWHLGDDRFVRCPLYAFRQTACLENNTCRKGQQGFLCGACAPGYTRRAMGWLCDKCQDGGAEMLKFLTALLVLLFLFMVSWWKIIQCQVHYVEGVYIQDSVIKIILNHVCLIQSTRIWDLYGVASLSGVYFWASPDCTLDKLTHDPYWTQDRIDIWLGLAVVGFCICLSLVYSLMGYIRARHDELHAFRGNSFTSRFAFSMVVTYFLTYDFLLRLALHTFSVRSPVPWDDKFRSKYQKHQHAFHDNQDDLWFASLVWIIGYHIMLPMALMRLMYSAKKYAGSTRVEFAPLFKFFAAGYEPKNRYWDFVMFFRRFLVIWIWAMPFIRDKDGLFRPSLTLVTSIAFLGLHVMEKPFDNRVHARMDTLEKNSLISWSLACIVDAITHTGEYADMGHEHDGWFTANRAPDYMLSAAMIFLELRFFSLALLLFMRRDLPAPLVRFLPSRWRYIVQPNYVVYNTKSGHIDSQHLHPQELRYLAMMLSEIHTEILSQPTDQIRSLRLGGTVLKAFTASCKAAYDIQEAKLTHSRLEEEKKMIKDSKRHLGKQGSKFRQWFLRHRVKTEDWEKEHAAIANSIQSSDGHVYPPKLKVSLKEVHPRIMALSDKVLHPQDSEQSKALEKLTSLEKAQLEKVIGRVEITRKNIQELSTEIAGDMESAVIGSQADEVLRTHDLAFEWLNHSVPETLGHYEEGHTDIHLTKKQARMAMDKHRELRKKQYDKEDIRETLYSKLEATRESSARGGITVGSVDSGEVTIMKTDVMQRYARNQQFEQKMEEEAEDEEDQERDDVNTSASTILQNMLSSGVSSKKVTTDI